MCEGRVAVWASATDSQGYGFGEECVELKDGRVFQTHALVALHGKTNVIVRYDTPY